MIGRDPEAATRQSFDVVVIGGGIQGAFLVLEAVRRGLRPLLLERADFGGATSWNTLRILHGGLRYLQHLDLRRFSDSVRERNWFLQHFPDLTRPLGCVMPLYGSGLRRPTILRPALLVNDALARTRNRDIHPNCRLPASTVFSRAETVSAFPQVEQRGLGGSACWYDATMLSPQRLLIETLRWSCSLGATVLNYVEASRLLIRNGRTVGVEAIDRVTGSHFDIQAPVVANCSGPWCRELAERCDRDIPSLFHPVLAFNLLLKRRPLSTYGLAVMSPRQQRNCFLLPLGDRMLAGTFQAPCQGGGDPHRPSPAQLAQFLHDLNAAIPDLKLGEDDVLRIDSGLLPASDHGGLHMRGQPIVLDHEVHGGPKGLYSISGVKFTTARSVATQALSCMLPKTNTLQSLPDRPPLAMNLALAVSVDKANLYTPQGEAAMCRVATGEAVVHLDDLVLRRTTWADQPEDLMELATSAMNSTGWDRTRQVSELARVTGKLRRQFAGAPSGLELVGVTPSGPVSPV